MVKKISQFLFERNDATFVRIRDMLREFLLPLGFAEEGPVPSGNIATFRRDRCFVELNCEFREQDFWVTAYSGLPGATQHLPQVWMNFYAYQYTPEKEGAIRAKLQQWLQTLDKQ